MKNNKKFAYKLTALPVLMVVMVLPLAATLGSAVPSMAQDSSRFDGEELGAIIEETTISVVEFVGDPDDDVANELADNVCLSFIAWSLGPDVDTDFANDVCNIEEEER